MSFEDERLLVAERADFAPPPSPSKKGGRRNGAGRPRGSCKGGRGRGGFGGYGGPGSGGLGGAGGTVV